MDTYNIGVYIGTARFAFTKYMGQAQFGMLIFQPLGDLLPNGGMFFDDAKISLMASHKSPVRNEIVDAAAGLFGRPKVHEVFESKLAKDVNKLRIGPCCQRLMNVIRAESLISEGEKREFEKLLEDHQLEFLEEAFYTALPLDNVSDEASPETEDIPFLTEVNGRCPLCHKAIVSTKKGKSVGRYEVVKIFDDKFPAELRSEIKAEVGKSVVGDVKESKIALCPNCASDYESDPSLNSYIKLLSVKQSILKRNRIQNQLDKLDVEKEIEVILNDLDIHSADIVADKLSYKPIPLKNKIPESEATFRLTIQNLVNEYYEYIEDRLSALDDRGQSKFDLIATEIKRAFLSLNTDESLTREEIFNSLSDWLCGCIGYPKEKRAVANVVLAFFVQNCEVFHEISE